MRVSVLYPEGNVVCYVCVDIRPVDIRPFKDFVMLELPELTRAHVLPM